jgi:two-component system sensor kinase FixL
VAGVLLDIRDATLDRRASDFLKRGNEQLQQLFSEAPVLLAFASGPDFRLNVVNRAFQSFFGGRHLKGRPLAEAIPEHAELGFDLIVEKAMQSGKAWVQHSVPVDIRDDISGEYRTRYVDLAFQPVYDVQGRPTGVLCVGSDVTERLKAEAERERLRHSLLHSSRVNAMGTMAMTLAHELNQPLAAAASYIGAARRLLLLDGMDESAAPPAMLHDARNQIARAGEVIRRMRSLIRTGEASRHPVSVGAVIDRVEQMLSAGGTLQIRVTKDIGEGAAKVMADEIQVEQIFINLLRNADQASVGQARREAVVSSRRVNDQWVRIEVRDFGRGLPPQIDNIFEGPHPSGSQGLGIGLSICRTLVEANGGRIQARRADGEGAVFEVDLEAAAWSVEDKNAVQPEPR